MIKSFVRNARSVNRIVSNNNKRFYFTSTFNDQDKFAKELKDYPTIVEGLEGQFAKELFRYAYNTNQLGYFKLSLEYVQSLGAQHRFVEKEFQEELNKAGVPDVIRTEFLTNVYESMLADTFDDIVISYNELYNAQNRIAEGFITLGEHYGPKYTQFLRGLAVQATPILSKQKRIIWNYKLDGRDLSGWRAIAESHSIDKSGASAIETDRTEGGIEGLLSQSK